MPPPAPRDLLVGRAGETRLEFRRAVAGVDEMGMAVDQAGRDPAALAVDRPGVVRRRGRVRFGTCENDAAAAGDDRAALDDAEAGRAPHDGREPGVPPDRRRLARRRHCPHPRLLASDKL